MDININKNYISDFLRVEYLEFIDENTDFNSVSFDELEPDKSIFIINDEKNNSLGYIDFKTAWQNRNKKSKATELMQEFTFTLDYHLKATEAFELLATKEITWAAILKDRECIGVLYLNDLVPIMNTHIKNIEHHYHDLMNKFKQYGEYLDLVCHDIRSPLSVVKMCCDYLLAVSEKYEYASEIFDFIDRIRRNTDRCFSIVNELLDLAKLKSGTPLILNDTNLTEYILNQMDNWKILGSKKSIKFKTDLQKDLYVHIDQKRFQHIIENLVNNAIKFSLTGEQIEIKTYSIEKNKGIIAAIEVKDKGPGIPKKDLDSLFEKFKQGDTGAMRELGVGLGLSIAKQLASIHNATIEIESEESKGSIFRILIPDAHLGADRTGMTQGNSYLGTVLIVDDDEDILRFMSETLTQEGYRAVLAPNGSEGLRLFRIHKPDLIISDLRMPKTDGFELLQMIKNESPDTPFLLTSGYYSYMDESELVTIFRADMILVKPFEDEDLIDATKLCLQNKVSLSETE